MNFLVYTGATHSVLKTPEGPLSRNKVVIQGATGKPKSYPWSQARISNLGKKTVTHSFLVIPECPDPLLGRDLLQKLKATISFSGDQPTVTTGEGKILTVTFPCEKEYRLLEDQPVTSDESLLSTWRVEVPRVWAKRNPPGHARHRPPPVSYTHLTLPTIYSV